MPTPGSSTSPHSAVPFDSGGIKIQFNSNSIRIRVNWTEILFEFCSISSRFKYNSIRPQCNSAASRMSGTRQGTSWYSEMLGGYSEGGEPNHHSNRAGCHPPGVFTQNSGIWMVNIPYYGGLDRTTVLGPCPTNSSTIPTSQEGLSRCFPI